MRMEVTMPEENLGDIMSDLQQRRAMITDAQAGVAIRSSRPMLRWPICSAIPTRCAA